MPVAASDLTRAGLWAFADRVLRSGRGAAVRCEQLDDEDEARVRVLGSEADGGRGAGCLRRVLKCKTLEYDPYASKHRAGARGPGPRARAGGGSI